jgi:hypothetical protein
MPCKITSGKINKDIVKKVSNHVINLVFYAHISTPQLLNTNQRKVPND